MKFLIIIASLIIIYTFDISIYANLCTCSRINYQNDCTFFRNCQWIGDICQPSDCKSLKTYIGCLKTHICAWVDNTCSTFTKCSDYSGTTNATCENQGYGCAQSNTSNTTSACIDDKSEIYEPNNTIICQTFTTNSTCYEAKNQCVWNGTQCKIFGCSDNLSRDTCIIELSENAQTVKICAWTSSCGEASSLSVLNASNCLSLTFGRATWNQTTSSCQQCSPQTDTDEANTDKPSTETTTIPKSIILLTSMWIAQLI